VKLEFFIGFGFIWVDTL